MNFSYPGRQWQWNILVLLLLFRTGLQIGPQIVHAVSVWPVGHLQDKNLLHFAQTVVDFVFYTALRAVVVH